MKDFLTSTNLIISIICGLFTIIGTIIGVLKRRQTAYKTIEYQPPQVQIAIQERWSPLALIWRTWMGILLGSVFAFAFTMIPDIVVNAFIQSANNSLTGFPDLSNPVIFAICAIFGVSIGITVALGIAAPKRFAQYQGQTRRSMFDPNNPFGQT